MASFTGRFSIYFLLRDSENDLYLGGLLCSTTVLCTRIVLAMNASEKDVIFNAKYHLWRCLHLASFKSTSIKQWIKEEGKLNMYTTRVWLLLDLEGWLFARCLSFLLCSFHLFSLYRYECGLSCKLTLASFGIITNSGRIRNRRLYSDGLHQCIRRNVIFRIFMPAT